MKRQTQSQSGNNAAKNWNEESGDSVILLGNDCISVDNLSSSQCAGRSFHWNWIIKDFKSFYNGKKKIESPTFSVYVGGVFEIRMSLRASSKRKSSTEHMSLGLICHNRQSNIWAQFRCAIINSTGNKEFEKGSETFNVTTPLGWQEFIRWDELLNESNGLLVDDQLEIVCNGSVLIEQFGVTQSTSAKRIKLEKKEGNGQVGTAVKSLLETGRFSDVTFVVEGKEFKAHQNILASRSPVFSAMFEDDMKEKQSRRVEIDDIDAEVFNELLGFIYTENVGNFQKLDEKLLAAADKYAVEDLKGICDKELTSKLSERNAARILILADRHSSKDLKANTIAFICRNANKVSRTDEWKAMGKTHPELMTEAFEAMAKTCGQDATEVE